jgi:hypothetical protein
MSKTKLMKFNLKEFPLAGVVCSTNFMNSDIRPKGEELTCESMV